MLTHERLRQALHYDPETGVFTRLIDSPNGRHKAGQVMGSSDGRFWFVWVDNKAHLAHRLAWFWMTGSLPKHQIDHKNLDTFDNRWVNLREATVSQNAMNRRGRSASGLKGVYFIDRPEKCGSKPWKAQIMSSGKRHWLGLFSTAEEAKAAYDAAAVALHGEFARLA